MCIAFSPAEETLLISTNKNQLFLLSMSSAEMSKVSLFCLRDSEHWQVALLYLDVFELVVRNAFWGIMRQESKAHLADRWCHSPPCCHLALSMLSSVMWLFFDWLCKLRGNGNGMIFFLTVQNLKFFRAQEQNRLPRVLWCVLPRDFRKFWQNPWGVLCSVTFHGVI